MQNKTNPKTKNKQKPKEVDNAWEMTSAYTHTHTNTQDQIDHTVGKQNIHSYYTSISTLKARTGSPVLGFSPLSQEHMLS